MKEHQKNILQSREKVVVSMPGRMEGPTILIQVDEMQMYEHHGNIVFDLRNDDGGIMIIQFIGKNIVKVVESWNEKEV